MRKLFKKISIMEVILGFLLGMALGYIDSKCSDPDKVFRYCVENLKVFQDGSWVLYDKKGNEIGGFNPSPVIEETEAPS